MNLTWLEKPINLLIAVLGLITTVFITGYKVGDYKKDLEQQLVLIKKQQECNESVQQEKDKCSEFKREVERKQLEDLKLTVKELSKLKGGINEK
jgi:hypothetical protein